MGGSVVITTPTAGDLSVAGGSIVVAGAVEGDELLVGGTVSSRAIVDGDLRVIGGNISVTEPVRGDLVALGYSVKDTGRASGSVFVAAANASLTGGADGPVTIYGNNVFLSGEFKDDVSIVAGGSVRFANDTVIRGALSYEAPEPAHIPASVTILGGTTYTNASYLPDVGTSRVLSVASLGIFLLVRIFGALILAGLIAGLFPGLAQAVAERAHTRRLRSILLTTLLGFAALAATPVLLVLLAFTFVGLGVAVLFALAYTLLLLIAFMQAGILLGTLLLQYFLNRETILWHDGVLGMLVLSIIALVPVIGWFVVCLLTAFTAGTLLILFFRFAFPRDESESEMV